MTSLAGLVVDTVDELRAGLAAYAADAGLAEITVRRVTFSLAYDPGTAGTPLPLPSSAGGVPAMRLAEAVTYLARHDRSVGVLRRDLEAAPRQRVARLELTIDLAPEADSTGG